jgi:hypothetical protein
MANLPALWAGTTVRTLALSTLLAVLAALALSVRWSHVLGLALAPSLLLWSTGIRLTNGLALLAVLVWTGTQLRRTPGAWKVGALVAAQIPLVLAPMLAAPRAAFFHTVVAQWTRSERGGLRYETLLGSLFAKVEFAFAPSTDYFPIPLLALVAIAGLAWSAWRGWRPDLSLPLRDDRSAQLALVMLAALVFVPHLAFEQVHFEYFTTPSVMLAVAVAIGAVRWAEGAGIRALAVYAALGILLVAAAVDSSREWRTWLSFGPGSVARLREVGREVRKLAGPDCTMVTFQTHLAVEAGCRPLPGLEYSLFSFLPDLPRDTAEARGVLTPELLDRRVAELRPELVVVHPRYLAKLLGRPGDAPSVRGGHAEAAAVLGDPGSALGAYAFHGSHRIGNGPRLPLFPASIRIDVYVRRDLLEGRGPP